MNIRHVVGRFEVKIIIEDFDYFHFAQTNFKFLYISFV